MDKNWAEVLEYTDSIRSGKKIACKELKQAVERFYRDLENPEYELDHTGPRFVIGIIEKTLKHQKGSSSTSRPSRAARGRESTAYSATP